MGPEKLPDGPRNLSFEKCQERNNIKTERGVLCFVDCLRVLAGKPSSVHITHPNSLMGFNKEPGTF